MPDSDRPVPDSDRPESPNGKTQKTLHVRTCTPDFSKCLTLIDRKPQVENTSKTLHVRTCAPDFSKCLTPNDRCLTRIDRKLGKHVCPAMAPGAPRALSITRLIQCILIPRWPPDGPKMPRDGPQMAPRWPQISPKLAQHAPRWLQDGPKMAP